MGINRAPWTALVDDSGQNLDGSMWNKAAIKTVLLDPIDALSVPWKTIPFDGTAFLPVGGGTWAFTAAQQKAFAYGANAGTKIATLSISLEGTTITGSPSYLTIRLPDGLVCGAARCTTPMIYYLGAHGIGYARIEAGLTQVQLVRDLLGTSWAAGSFFCDFVLSFGYA